jgi:cell division protein FtsZ
VIDDALGDEVRVTVIAAGFDKLGPEGGRLAKATEAEPKTEREPVPSLLEEEDEEMFRPAPETVVFDAEEDLDIPDFLKS